MKELQEIAREITPKLSAHSTNILLNMDLFARIRAVNDQKDDLDLNQEQSDAS
jgi:peptidyl-dipeptidase Dcp